MRGIQPFTPRGSIEIAIELLTVHPERSRGATVFFFAVVSACAPLRSVDDGGTGPRCTVTDAAITCAPRIDSVKGREVYWQQPPGEAPAPGRPVVLVYQGSFFGPPSTWNTVQRELAFGGYQQARLQALLLERGFTVIAPAAIAGIAWQTNTAVPWDLTDDKPVIDELLAALGRGDFGPVDLTRLYATGISSGGYMTSRMALSYPGTFRALAIASASWATCASAACVLPDTLPAAHPPTRLLHGRLDVTVPIFTAELYSQALKDQGHEAELVIDESAGHEWLADSPELVVGWFETH